MSIHIRTKLGRQGFTLTELLVVIAVLSILAAVAIPSYLGVQKRAARSEAYSNLQSMRLLEEQFFAENSCYYVKGNCTNATFNEFHIADSTCKSGNRVRGFDDGTFLPGFNPGCVDGLNYTYTITITTSTEPNAGPATAFVATATGRAGGRVAGEVVTIDNNNVRNPNF